MARALDNDPEQLDMVCLALLDYSEAHAVHRRADKRELEAWRESPLMQTVTEYASELAEAEMREAEARVAEAEG